MYEQAINSTLHILPATADWQVFCSRRYPTPAATIKAAQVATGPTSTLARNVAFLSAHRDDLQALHQTAMWVTP